MQQLNRRKDSWLHKNYFLICLTDGLTTVLDFSLLQFRAGRLILEGVLETFNLVSIQESQYKKRQLMIKKRKKEQQVNSFYARTLAGLHFSATSYPLVLLSRKFF